MPDISDLMEEEKDALKKAEDDLRQLGKTRRQLESRRKELEEKIVKGYEAARVPFKKCDHPVIEEQGGWGRNCKYCNKALGYSTN